MLRDFSCLYYKKNGIESGETDTTSQVMQIDSSLVEPGKFEKVDKYNIYPNPAKSEITVSIHLNGQPYQLSVYSSIG